MVLKTSVLLHKEHFSLAYASFFLNCLLPGSGELDPDFSRVFLIPTDQERVKNFTKTEEFRKLPRIDVFRYPEGREVEQKKEGKMAVSIKPFHYEWNRALWLIEFMEFYKILGEYI